MKKLVTMMVAFGMAVAAVAAQCEATTLKGTQCKRQAQEGGKLCWQHAKMSGVKTLGTCQAKTVSGESCTRKVENGATFCWQHAKNVQSAATEAAEKPVKATKAKAKKAADETVEVAEKPAKATKAKAKKTAEAVDDAKEAVAGRCQAKTASGEPCKRKAVPGKKFCFQHAK